MSEELLNVSAENVETANIDYIEALNELKSSTVSKEQYAKLKADNKRLLDALVNGEQIETPKKEVYDVKELRKKLFDRDNTLSNLEYVDTALKLRQTLMENGERDPFLPTGTVVQETAEMHDKAEAVANVLQECVDFADGDSGIFTAELQRRTKDISIRKHR